jgi:predicted nucleic acid-binding protein
VRLVIDTNTIVSGSLWQGPPARLISAALGGQARMFLSLPMLLELRETLEMLGIPAE